VLQSLQRGSKVKGGALVRRVSQTRAGFLKVHGAKLYYEVADEGRPLLLLHAGIGDSRMWEPQWHEFASECRVIRTDLRGYGRTVVPSGRFSYHEDVAALLSYLGEEMAVVAGLSFGGRVAIDFALAYPQMVSAVVLGAPAVSGQKPSEELQRFSEEEDRLLGLGDLKGATELNLRTWVDGPFRIPDQVDSSVRERMRELQMDVFGVAVPEDAEDEPLEPPAMERLEEIQVPTLIVVGELDQPDFLEIADTLASRIPKAEKVVIPGVAHLPSMENPDQFNHMVLDFLGGHSL
jgi:pimeloyl-ACP methyl ester carboxylesterase